MTGTPISPTDITVRPATPVCDPLSTAADTPAEIAQLPHPRETTEGRHRRGVTVAALIGGAGSVSGAASMSGAPLANVASRRGGAHRLRRPGGRHRASRTYEAADRMAHRRTIGGRPARGVGRTALTLFLLVVVAAPATVAASQQALVLW